MWKGLHFAQHLMESMGHIPSNRDRLAINKLVTFLEQMQIFTSSSQLLVICNTIAKKQPFLASRQWNPTAWQSCHNFLTRCRSRWTVDMSPRRCGTCAMCIWWYTLKYKINSLINTKWHFYGNVWFWFQPDVRQDGSLTRIEQRAFVPHVSDY